jgi:small conductance mechanosensitive channel
MDNMTLLTCTNSIFRAAVLLIIGFPLLIWSRKKIVALLSPHFSLHGTVLISRFIFYGGIIFIAVTILHEFGFNLSTLLGVAGVFGFAIGFASQTSIANIISGFFLVLERPFSIGDFIKSNDVGGIVESIGLLSLSIRTPDNKLVRLPNETVLKNNLINLTYYSTRRIDCLISVSYANEVEHMQAQMYAIIKGNALFLHHPIPIVSLHKIGQHDYDTEMRTFFMLRVWVKKKDFPTAPAVLMQELKAHFDTLRQIISITHVNGG